MSGFIVHDLYCPGCDEFEKDVLYRRSNGRPKCAECGDDRRVAWLDPPRMTPEFEPIETATGTIETRAQFNKMVEETRKKHPNAEVVISGDSRKANAVRAEEARHRGLTNLRAKGYCEADVRERKAELKRKKLESSSSR